MKLLSLDIETTGLSPWKNSITCVGGWQPDSNFVIRDNYNFLKTLNTPIVGQNFKFDLKFIKVQLGIDLLNLYAHDTQIMAHVCLDKIPDEWLEIYEYKRRQANKKLPHGFSHRQASRYSLKTMAPYFLGVDPFWETPDNHDNNEYVLKDCEYTYRLFEFFEKKLKEQNSWDFYQKLMGWNKMLYKMELRGIELNFSALKEAEEEYLEIRQTLEAEIKEQWKAPIADYFKLEAKQVLEKYDQMTQTALAKLKDEAKRDATVLKYTKLKNKAMAKIEPFNLSSSAQMMWLLRDYQKYDVTDTEGKESTKKSVLNKLVKEGKQDVKKYLAWRDADKVLTMYLPTYNELHDNGVIHTSFNITGTRTGRLSSSSPNCQQISSKLYKLFKPRDGHQFIQYDLSGIEAALIALYSGDKNLFKILKEGHSIHDYNTITFFNLDCDPADVPVKYAKERKTSKTIGFALFYGAGFKRIKESFLQNGYPITDAEAKQKLQQFKKFYSGATEFHKNITEAFEAGDVVKNLFGRPIKIQAWENAFMNGFNTLVQSSASDLNIRACEKAFAQWEKEGLAAHPLLLIHDAIIAECPTDQADRAAKILVNSMTGFNLETEHGKIDLKVEGGVYEIWKK